jgi:hypothetical protein
MNKLLVAILAFATLSTTSCKKEHKGGTKEVVLNVTLKKGETYNLDLTKYGDDDDASKITTQAVHYVTSAITKQGTGIDFSDVYTYQTAGSVKTEGTATDKVVLNVYENKRSGQQNQNNDHHDKDDDDCDDDATNITINFNITE